MKDLDQVSAVRIHVSLVELPVIELFDFPRVHHRRHVIPEEPHVSRDESQELKYSYAVFQFYSY